MLDDLLGRTSLKERIDALESERDRLERRLAAETDRRKQAVRDRQDADERVNRLEDRIAELEDRVERASTDEPGIEYRGVETVRADRCEAILDRLTAVSTGAEGALTAMVDEEVPEPVRSAFDEHAVLVRRAAPCLVCTDDAGLVSVALVPPLRPAPFVGWDDGFRLEREWFLPTGPFAMAVVRSDLFALGEYDGSTRRSVVGFESDVKGKHAKGGFSQARFERRRDDQIDDHLERCRSAIADRSAERLIVVGERTLLAGFAGDARATAPVGATGKPAAALDDAFREFWTTRLYRI